MHHRQQFRERVLELLDARRYQIRGHGLHGYPRGFQIRHNAARTVHILDQRRARYHAMVFKRIVA